MTYQHTEAADVFTDEELADRVDTAIATGNKSSWEVADGFAALSMRGWTQQKIADRWNVSQPSVSKFVACARKYSVLNNRPQFWDAFQGVNSESAHVSHNSGENEWYTPEKYLEAARKVLGKIDLDPASSPVAQENVKASRFFTIENDGLSQIWNGRVFLNPPYSKDLIGQFSLKLAESYTSGGVSAAVLLVNNATETQWFQHIAEPAECICFPEGRIQYLDASGNPANTPLQGQAFLYFGNKGDKFVKVFSELGFVARFQ